QLEPSLGKCNCRSRNGTKPHRGNPEESAVRSGDAVDRLDERRGGAGHLYLYHCGQTEKAAQVVVCMSWIKRNLYFLIGTVVALALLGLAGFYLYSKWSLNNKVLEDLTQKHEDLKKLNSQNPHPGSGNINNIDTAREQ